jgi:hypothetical protein
MKKLIEFVMPFKLFTAMIFSGFMILYMISSIFYSIVTGGENNYSVPFVFVLQSVGLSIIISVLWGVFFSNTIIKKWRFFLRHIMFVLSLIAILSIYFFNFFNISTEGARIWFIVAVIIAIFIIVLSCISEIYFRKIGKNYTEMLNIYKKNNL